MSARALTGLALAVACALTACSAAPSAPERSGVEVGQKATPLELLQEDIREGAEMLERGEARAFLNRYVHPDDRERFDREFAGPEALESFEAVHAVALSKVLEYLASERPEPEMSEDATSATYALPESLGAPSTRMVFGRVGDDWYIYN